MLRGARAEVGCRLGATTTKKRALNFSLRLLLLSNPYPYLSDLGGPDLAQPIHLREFFAPVPEHYAKSSDGSNHQDYNREEQETQEE